MAKEARRGPRIRERLVMRLAGDVQPAAHGLQASSPHLFPQAESGDVYLTRQLHREEKMSSCLSRGDVPCGMLALSPGRRGWLVGIGHDAGAEASPSDWPEVWRHQSMLRRLAEDQEG